MRSVLICHAGDDFDREGLAAWLASFSQLAGVVVLQETSAQKRARVRREIRRVGWMRFLDVVAMRLYQRLALATRDRHWTQWALTAMHNRYGSPPQVPVIVASDVNDADVMTFLRKARPDFVLARCKQLIKKKLIKLPRLGCFVLHPGICPEYRNAHGCFWALAQRDLDRVGMTLLKVDAGVDTGPVYGYYRYSFDERQESHVVIQYRVVMENLDAIATRFKEIEAGTAKPLDTSNRASAAWGQPWLTRYLRWQREAIASADLMTCATLMYHDVVVPGASDASGFPGPAAAHYKLDVTAFARHLAALAQSGLSFDSVLTEPTPGTVRCLLTFDDGGASAAAVATVLAEHGMIGHFFITTAHIGTPGFVTYSDILALRAAGHVVGTHSHTHPAEMSRLSPTVLTSEWRLSTDRLSHLLGEPVTVGSVPGGFYSTDVARAAAAAGIRYLFTSEPSTSTWQVDGCTVLGRYALWQDSPASLAAALALGTQGARQLQWLAWNAKKPLKRWARPVYRVVRGSLLRAR